ncbi:hypothetical protein [Tabrizicola sp.]|uniref:hypothetical protein n=1 Tax=Tabrizicola sp. TaxID=2005166 RepID=UPI00286A90DA|nr:hypothetical protein [Tabrizicola sp.]
MSNRFPPLTAPVPGDIGAYRRSVFSMMPRWLQSLPLGELLVLTAIGLALAMA